MGQMQLDTLVDAERVGRRFRFGKANLGARRMGRRLTVGQIDEP